MSLIVSLVASCIFEILSSLLLTEFFFSNSMLSIVVLLMDNLK